MDLHLHSESATPLNGYLPARYRLTGGRRAKFANGLLGSCAAGKDGPKTAPSSLTMDTMVASLLAPNSVAGSTVEASAVPAVEAKPSAGAAAAEGLETVGGVTWTP